MLLECASSSIPVIVHFLLCLFLLGESQSIGDILTYVFTLHKSQGYLYISSPVVCLQSNDD